MSDLAMCQDNDCPSRSTCRRHKASGTVPNVQWQGYGAFRRIAHDAAYCSYYVAVAPSPMSIREIEREGSKLK